MSKHGKRYRAAAEKVDIDAKYELKEALALATRVKSEKFDESVDVAVKLSVDPRKADQNIRGSVVLPRGTGKQFRVLVFAKGEKEKEARDAGAVEVGGDDLVAKIQGGWMDFDRVVATPDMMGQVGKLGKVLGPRGLMPNPKLGTVTTDVAKAVEAAKGGQVEYRAEKTGIVHSGVGKASFDQKKLVENVQTFIDTVAKARPSGVKGTYIQRIAISSTMGIGVKVEHGSGK